MKKFHSILGLLFPLVLAGCTAKISAPPGSSFELVHKPIKMESEQLAAAQQELVADLEKVSPKFFDEQPVLPAYDPLENHLVSFSMVGEDLQIILYSLSQAVGMNLIIDPAISAEKRPLTLNFQNVSAATVLKEILKNYDLYYEIHENVIRILPFQERIFKLDFLDTNITTSFEVGGDVLGAAKTATSGGLKGRFELSGQTSKHGNSYDVLEKMVTQIISKSGKYSLNRLSGSLYIKDTPSIIQSISKLITHYKHMLSRQILIETRIIEVGLSDEYQYGIDWSVLRDKAAALTSNTSVAWNLGTGLVLSHANKDVSIDAAMEALKTFGNAKVVSNPSIRVKHGKPALISVGTSFTYKKEVQTTREVTSGTDREVTNVVVSTVFDGLILGVIPFIGKNKRISLLINPINSSVDRASLVPESVGGDQEIALPEVRVKEMSTTIALEDGDVVVLGGLIDKVQGSQTKEVPILSAIPIFGYLFKNEFNTEEIRELVIILTAKLI